MKTALEIPDKDIEEIASFLNTLLVDEYVLYTKTRNAHWNINGPNFYELHKFFQTQYEVLDAIVEDIARRVRSLGHYVVGSLKDFLTVTNMEIEKYDFSNPEQIIQTLVNDHETNVRIMRNNNIPFSDKYKELDTADFVNELVDQHEKMAWMLKSFVS